MFNRIATLASMSLLCIATLTCCMEPSTSPPPFEEQEIEQTEKTQWQSHLDEASSEPPICSFDKKGKGKQREEEADLEETETMSTDHAIITAIFAHMGQYENADGPAHSAIIKLPDLPENIVPIILRYTPLPVTHLVDHFERGTKIVALFKGAPGTGKTSLAYALAKAIGIPITHIQASGVITPLQGSGEKTLDHDLLPIINAKQRHIVLIDEMDQIFGYGDEKKARSVMLHLNGLIGMSHPNIMYIGTTNKYELIDPALRTHLTNCIEIPYPSPEYRKAIIRALLPEGNNRTFQCPQRLRDDEFLNLFVASLDKISIRELISIIERIKGCALARRQNPMTLEQQYTQRLGQGQAAIGNNGGNIGTIGPNEPTRRVELTEQDFYTTLQAYQTEVAVQHSSRFNNFLKKSYTTTNRLLPYANFTAREIYTSYTNRKQEKQFQKTMQQEYMNNMSVGTQMGRSAIQFFIATGNQIQQAEQQLKQQQDQFESQKAHLEEQAKEEKKMGIWDATLSTARTGGSIGKGYAGIPGYIAGAVAGAVIGGTVSTVTTYAPEIYDWTTTKAKKAAEKCTIQ